MARTSSITVSIGATGNYTRIVGLDPLSGDSTPAGIGTSKIEKNLGTVEFSTDPGLRVFDTSPVAIAQSGSIADGANRTRNIENPTTNNSGPSTRPYIWKYQ